MNHAEDLLAVRLASQAEAPVISAVLHQAFVEYEPLYTAAAYAATVLDPEQIRNRWQEGPVWVALQDGDVVGTVAAVPGEQGVYVRSMAILPTARGHGLGRMLLEHVERYAGEQAARRLFLSTTPFLHRAIRLYERYGFARTEDGPYELHGTPLFTMAKPVEPARPDAGV